MTHQDNTFTGEQLQSCRGLHRPIHSRSIIIRMSGLWLSRDDGVSWELSGLPMQPAKHRCSPRIATS